jgi:hypothetical protein
MKVLFQKIKRYFNENQLSIAICLLYTSGNFESAYNLYRVLN